MNNLIVSPRNNSFLTRIGAFVLALFALVLLQACKPQQAETVSPAGTATPAVVESGALEQVPAEPLIYEKSVAVLPFTDLSENSDQDYFTDGITRDLINKLAMMEELQVAGEESSFYYKGKDEVLGVIGESLEVANILLGSVRKSGDQLRISAQLVSAADGFNIWSRTWDRELSDVFAIQDEIAEEVTTALSVTLGAGRFNLPGMTRNIGAYDLTLQAIAEYDRFTPDNVFRGINLLEEALRIDPQYGRGWMLLGSMYYESPLILSADQAADFPALAAKAFNQARLIAPDMPGLLLVDAGLAGDSGQLLQSEGLYKRFMENYGYTSARALHDYAQLLGRTGQLSAAVELLARAKQLEPKVPRYSYQLALFNLFRGNIEIARTEAQFGSTLDGGAFFFDTLDWLIAMREKDLPRAAALIEQYYASDRATADTTVSKHFMLQLAAILKANDFAASADDLLKLIESPSVTPLELTYIARVVALMDQPEAALDYWFGEAASPAIWDEIFTRMRSLPDFKVWAQEKGLEEYWRTSGNWGDYCQPEGQGFVCR